MTIRGNDARFRVMTDDAPPPRESKSFHRGGKKFLNRAERRREKFGEKPFRKDHDERDFGDKPFRRTRRFGRH